MPVVTMNKDEKQKLKDAVGSSCAILTATVARLFSAEGGSWQNTNILGAATLVFNDSQKCLQIRIYDLKNFKEIFSQELWEDFDYDDVRPHFHTFEGDDCVLGLNFAEEKEASSFAAKVKQNIPKPGVKVSLVKKNKAKKEKKGWFGRKKKKEDKPRLEISAPRDFRQLGHIGWDPEKGFDIRNIPPEWKRLFDKAGVTEDQLKDKETSQFLVEWATQNAPLPGQEGADGGGGGAPPPPPSRGSAPPPPPSRGAAPPPPPSRGAAPPPPASRGSAPPPPASRGSAPPPPSRGAAPPPPSRGAAPPPPGRGGAPPPPGRGGAPPPPAPAAPSGGAPPPAPPPPPPAPAAPPPPPAGGPKASAPPPPSRGGGGGGGGGLLGEIQGHGGVNRLKKAEQVEKPVQSEAQENTMANALAAAMSGRRGALKHDTDSDDDEWDDDDDW